MNTKFKLVLLLFFPLLFVLFSAHTALADTVTLSGSVKDSGGSAISGATVSVNDASSDSTVTDRSGNYSLSIPSGTYNIQVTPPSGSGLATTVDLSQNVTTSKTVNFILTINGNNVIFNGQLTDQSGNGVPGAQITLANSSNTQYSATTDTNGNYSIQLPPGSYSINVVGSYQNASYNVFYQNSSNNGFLSVSQNTTLNVTLPFNAVNIHIQDTTGTAIPNVTIGTNNTRYTIQSLAGGSLIGLSSASNLVTDTNGNVSFSLFPGGYGVQATPPTGSIYSQFSEGITVSSGSQTDVISLQYNHATPTTTANLATQYPDGEYTDPTTVSLTASAAAGYTVANTYYTVDGGTQQTYNSPFTVTGNGNHAIKYWSVDNKGLQETLNTKSFTITEAYSLTGNVYVDANQDGVLDNGEQGYAGATVALNTGQTTTTDSYGNYTFSNLEAGTYTVQLTDPNGYTDTTINPAVVALNANTTTNFGIVQANSLVTAINAGGNTAGNYVADTDSTGGTTYTSSASVDTSGVSNPGPQAVYQTVRYGNFTYTIPNLTANGTYTLRLHFNEVYWGTSLAGGNGGVGSRVFNVSVNGTNALTNFDIYQSAGGANKAVVEQIPATADANGNITVQFSTVTDNAMVNGIELYNGTLPTPSPTPTPTPVQSVAINPGGIAAGSYLADTDFNGGTTYSSTASVDTSSVTNPAPQSVYQSVRYGNFTYTIPTYAPSTSYHVRLHFNEIYWGTPLSGNQGGNGSRVFNVTINGTQVLNNFDIYQAAGGANKAVTQDFDTTTDSLGRINIQFATVTDNALVNGIEITKN